MDWDRRRLDLVNYPLLLKHSVPNRNGFFKELLKFTSWFLKEVSSNVYMNDEIL